MRTKQTTRGSTPTTPTTSSNTAAAPTPTSNEQLPWVYLVSSLQCGEDPCSPTVEGVYTTKEAAIENARKIFASKAESYSLGDNNSYSFTKKKKGRCAKEDNTDTVIFTESCTYEQVLLEVIRDPEDVAWSVVIAINACKVNSFMDDDENGTDCVPLLYSTYWSGLASSALVDTPDADLFQQQQEEEGSNSPPKMHVVMYVASQSVADTDVTLAGVFTTKQKAMEAAQKALLRNSQFAHEEEVEEGLLQDVEERGMLFFSDETMELGIAMDTVVLNEEAKDGKPEMELTTCSGIWMKPDLGGGEVEDEDDEEEEAEDDEEAVMVVDQEKENAATTNKIKPDNKRAAECKPAASQPKNEPMEEEEQEKENVAANIIKPSDSPQPKKQKLDPAQSSNSPADKKCSTCLATKGWQQYSKNQWKKNETQRKCKICIETMHKTTKKEEEHGATIGDMVPTEYLY